MEQLNGIPAEYQALAGIVFVVALSLFAAWSKIFGSKEAVAPKVQEFYAAGGLHDMGPVKELVEGVGLLYQQQVKATIQLERTAAALEKGAEAYVAHLEAEATQEEIERRAREMHEKWRAEEPRRGQRKPAE